MFRIALLAGDGIGPETTAAARRVLDAAGFEATYDEVPVGWSCWRNEGDALPASTLETCRAADAILFGAITSKPADEAEAELRPALQDKGLVYRSPIVRLRQELELFTNVRTVRFWPNVPSVLAHAPEPDGDGRPATITVFRENTEDLYSGFEAHPEDDVALDSLGMLWPKFQAAREQNGPRVAATMRLNTERATRRIIDAALSHAKAETIPSVTLAEKPNVMRATGGLVRRIAHEVAERYPEIALREVNVDALACDLVIHPERYPVIVATNLFGDILSDLAAGLAGGLGLAPSANLGIRHALFEPVHGSAPDIAGQGVANPTATILAAALMARHLGESEIADRIEAAIGEVYAQRRARTPDLGGQDSTTSFTDAVIEAIEESQRGLTKQVPT